jgi:cytochrome c oxidase subunit IV
MAHQPVSVRTYLLVYAALLGLTALTVAIVEISDRSGATPGAWEVVVALGIASVKTALVGWFFMHLMHANRLVFLFIAGGVLFLAIMLGLTWADYATRNWFFPAPVPGP